MWGKARMDREMQGGRVAGGKWKGGGGQGVCIYVSSKHADIHSLLLHFPRICLIFSCNLYIYSSIEDIYIIFNFV